MVSVGAIEEQVLQLFQLGIILTATQLSMDISIKNIINLCFFIYRQMRSGREDVHSRLNEDLRYACKRDKVFVPHWADMKITTRDEPLLL